MQFWLNMSSRRLLDSQQAGPGRAVILLVLMSTDLKLGGERAENQHPRTASSQNRAGTSHHESVDSLWEAEDGLGNLREAVVGQLQGGDLGGEMR